MPPGTDWSDLLFSIEQEIADKSVEEYYGEATGEVKEYRFDGCPVVNSLPHWNVVAEYRTK